ncbi:MAG: class I tRNA ligase family protein, partial [Planctomycetota bacterium]
MAKSTTTKPKGPARDADDDEHPHRYDAALANEIEARWQAHWEQHRTNATPNPGDPGFDAKRPKLYVLDMFPYPSGAGLHVGHPLGYIATDIYCRYQRMRGINVLHPMGFDAFGLPAEQYAVEHGVHPRATTERNISTYERQLKVLGLGYDWDRSLATIDQDYYRWTQWIFLQLYHSYFDSGQDKARPISELVAALEQNKLVVGANDEVVAEAVAPPRARRWSELDDLAKERVLAARRLAYMAEVPVNWCPALGTVLANEEVTNEGRSERGNHPVYKRPLKQWMLRITAYAEQLASDLAQVDWPEAIKAMQLNWIGRSDGAMVAFPLAEASTTTSAPTAIRVFTTRPDTIFGATYMVLAPEHPLVDEVTTPEHRNAVSQYRQEARSRSDVDRMAEVKTKTGVFTGGFAINPATDEPIPIWMADYVLMGYGTGAIMAVPGHDARDWAFARQFRLPVRCVVEPPPDYEPSSEEAALACSEDGRTRWPFAGEGTGINSSNDGVSLDGLPTPQAKQAITRWLESKGLGRAKVQYKLHDWLFSRQRYWGEPFPILHAPDGRIVAVDESELPVELPEMEDFAPTAVEANDSAP